MKVHMVGICGAGMGSLSGLFKEAGWEVRGSDKTFYKPMSERLKAWEIETMQGYAPEHIAQDTDLVVVGNACNKTNPEAREAFARNIRVMSFPKALAELFICKKRSVVIAGTHGKTSTTSLLAYVLVEAGYDPGFLIGGVPLNFGKSFHLGKGDEFLVEGDEYGTAFFDHQPKFIHYCPQIVVLTSVEFDHADFYADMDAYKQSFRTLVKIIPTHGLLVACVDNNEVAELARQAKCHVLTYGFKTHATWQISNVYFHGKKTYFCIKQKGYPLVQLSVPLAGSHNVLNATAVLAVCEHLGIKPKKTIEYWHGFQGVTRRMQVCGEYNGVTVIDDFAHHPTEVRETINALKARYPEAKLVAVFEPRTNTSRRRFFENQYIQSFAHADQVVLVPPFDSARIPRSERFDSQRVVHALCAKGQNACVVPDAACVVQKLVPKLTQGTVVVIMSNGAFDNIQTKLINALQNRRY